MNSDTISRKLFTTWRFLVDSGDKNVVHVRDIEVFTTKRFNKVHFTLENSGPEGNVRDLEVFTTKRCSYLEVPLYFTHQMKKYICFSLEIIFY